MRISPIVPAPQQGVNFAAKPSLKVLSKPLVPITSSTAKTFKAPSFLRKMIFGLMTVGAAIGFSGCGYKGHDYVMEGKMRAYAESRDMTQAEADEFVYADDFRNMTTKEYFSASSQQELDYTAFTNILNDNGYAESDAWYCNIIDPVGLNMRRTTENIHKAGLTFIKSLMSAREYQKFIEKVDDEVSFVEQPYFRTALYQYIADSLGFAENEKDRLESNYQLRRDFEKICKALRPVYKDYSRYYDGHMKGKPKYIFSEHDVLRWHRERFDK